MTKTRIFAAALSLLVLSSAGVAFAEQPVTLATAAADAIEHPHSVNLGVGTLWGSPSVTYQHLFRGGHGLLVGANAFYARHAIGTGMGAGGSIGYRWHWSERQDSGFLGLHAGFDRDRAPMRITIDDMSEDALVHVNTFYLVGNVGKRWIVGERINITARIGGGLALRRLSTDAEDVEPLVGVMQGLLGLIPMTIDGELSVGYTF